MEHLGIDYADPLTATAMLGLILCVYILSSILCKSFKYILVNVQRFAKPKRIEDYWDADTYTFRIGKFIQYSKDPGNNLYTATINASLFKAIVDVMEMKVSVMLDFSGFVCPELTPSTTIDVVKYLRRTIYNKTGCIPMVNLGVCANTPKHESYILRQVQIYALS